MLGSLKTTRPTAIVTAMVGRMISHLRFQTIRAYSAGFRWRKLTLIYSTPLSRAEQAGRLWIRLKGGQGLARLFGIGKASLLVHTQGSFQLAAGSGLLALSNQRHTQMEAKAGTGQRVAAASIGFIHCHGLAQLFSGGAVEALLVINPAECVRETGHVRI